MEQTKPNWSDVLQMQPPDETQPQKHFFEDFTLEELEEMENKYYYFQQQEEQQFYNNLEQV